MEAFTLRRLSFTYPGQTEPALRDVTLSVPAGAFVVLCGVSGCGKTTLLRQLKPELAPHGTRTGALLFEGRPLEEADRRAQCARIGFVMQSPENQLVTDKVWHELAFGLESLGFDTPAIRRRVAEMAGFFGMEEWFHRDVASLSGGQKQLVNLASVLALQPDVLLLDEPTSQLDPIAAEAFFAALGRVNRELGVTVIVSEHRLGQALPLADLLAVLDGGRLVAAGPPDAVCRTLRERGEARLLRAMPAPARVWAAAETDAPCPITVRDGRAWLQGHAAAHPLRPLPPEPHRASDGAPALEADGLWFRYDGGGADVLRGVSLQVRRGELYALLGGNGAGKSTALQVLAGVEKPQRGTVRCAGRAALLPQDPKTLFVKKTVREELLSMQTDEAAVAHAVALCRLEGLLDRHPYDLSGGEQQRAALAKVLLTGADVLLLDEPTKSLDAAFQTELAEILRTLLRQGAAILAVSHDAAFCARYAHRCALLFDGEIAAEDTPRAFFSGNRFYTTEANRMARGLAPGAVTAEDLIYACGGALPQEPALPEHVPPLPDAPERERGGARERLPRRRVVLASASAAVALAAMLRAVRISDLSQWIAEDGTASLTGEPLLLALVFVAALFVCALAVGRRGSAPAVPPRQKRRLTARTRCAAVLVVLLIPLTLYAGERVFNGQRYSFIALLVLLECMLPFFLLFEGRKPQPRELVTVAVLCALGVAGRAAFFMLPQVKPVLALTILAGVAFGGETGFLVGAMTMLASNVLFGQGPWTPWQMFGMGAVGFLAGVLFRAGLLRRSRQALCLFGALSAVVIYGGILNTAHALLAAGTLTRGVLLAGWVAGFPMDCVHALATAAFLRIAAEPMLEKLDRVREKYGLMQ